MTKIIYNFPKKKRKMNFGMSSGKDSKFMTTLPKKIQERLQVLLALHEEYEVLKKECKNREIDLRMKFSEEFQPIYEQRKKIVSGEEEPSTELVKDGIPEDHEDAEVLSSDAKAEDEPPFPPSVGLKEFWLTVFTNHAVLRPLIAEEDKPVLRHLVDVTSSVLPGEMGNVKVTFTFSPNEYFKETELSLSVVGSEISGEIVRTPITFTNPNFLYNSVKVKAKGKGLKQKGGAPRMITKRVPRQSFFWIFEEFDEDEEDEEQDEGRLGKEEIKDFLFLLNQKIIPAAIDFYTGMRDGVSDLDDDYSVSDFDDEEDEDNEDDEKN